MPKSIIISLSFWTLFAASACSGTADGGGASGVGGGGGGGASSTGGDSGLGASSATGGGTTTGGASGSGGSQAPGGTSASSGNSSTGGATAIVQCPQSPPSNAAPCEAQDMSCFYDSCPNGGRTLANCTNGTWSVQNGTNCDVSCSGNHSIQSCNGGEICVISQGGALLVDCRISNCDPGLVTPQCVGAYDCDMSTSLDTGVTITCNTCPEGNCP